MMTARYSPASRLLIRQPASQASRQQLRYASQASHGQASSAATDAA